MAGPAWWLLLCSAPKITCEGQGTAANSKMRLLYLPRQSRAQEQADSNCYCWRKKTILSKKIIVQRIIFTQSYQYPSTTSSQMMNKNIFPRPRIFDLNLSALLSYDRLRAFLHSSAVFHTLLQCSAHFCVLRRVCNFFADLLQITKISE